MKRFCSIILSVFLSITSFLLVSKNVYAVSYNATITDTTFNVLDDLPSYKSTLDTIISNNSSTYSNYYIIYYQGYSEDYRAVIFKPDIINSTTLRPGGDQYFVWYNSNQHLYLNSLNGIVYTCKINLSGTLSNCSSTTRYFDLLYDTTGYYKIPLYSNVSMPIRNAATSTDITFYYNSSSITYTNSEELPTLLDLQDIFLTPPTPTDDFPLLTSFYNLCLEKFVLISEEFSSNYIYIAIITIFLLITIVYFLKRRLT